MHMYPQLPGFPQSRRSGSTCGCQGQRTPADWFGSRGWNVDRGPVSFSFSLKEPNGTLGLTKRSHQSGNFPLLPHQVLPSDVSIQKCSEAEGPPERREHVSGVCSVSFLTGRHKCGQERLILEQGPFFDLQLFAQKHANAKNWRLRRPFCLLFHFSPHFFTPVSDSANTLSQSSPQMFAAFRTLKLTCQLV